LIIEHRALWLGEMIIRPAAENVVGKVKNGGAKLLESATPAEPMLCLFVGREGLQPPPLMAAALACAAQAMTAAEGGPATYRHWPSRTVRLRET
jgi:hypothetical protein